MSDSLFFKCSSPSLPGGLPWACSKTISYQTVWVFSLITSMLDLNPRNNAFFQKKLVFFVFPVFLFKNLHKTTDQIASHSTQKFVRLKFTKTSYLIPNFYIDSNTPKVRHS